MSINDYQKAKDFVLRVLEFPNVKEDMEHLARADNLIAEIYMLEKDKRAFQYAQKVLEIVQQTSERINEIKALITMGKAQALLNNDILNGVKNIKRAIAIAAETNLLQAYADGLFSLGEVMVFEKKIQSALNYLNQAKKIYSELGLKRQLNKLEEFIAKIANQSI